MLQNPLAIMALLVMAVVLVVLFVPLPNSGDDARAGDRSPPTLGPRPSPDATEPASNGTKVRETSPQGAPPTAMTLEARPGLLGEGASRSTAVHDVTLTVTSDAPVWVLGYLVPTSPDRSYGKVKKPGSSWSMSTVVTGPPDYAQIFAQSGPKATRITCTVSVDGRVTERRTATGPYGQLFCQG